MKIALYAVGAVVALVLIVVAIGYMLPVAHVASSERTMPAPPEAVFAIITAPADFPKWRTDVKSVDIVPAEGGKPRFRERGSNGDILMEVEEQQPSKRLVTRIADKKLPFGGSWTFELTPSGTGTTLRITENGEVYNPVFRFMARYVLGHAATMERYLADLERHISRS